MGNANCNQCKKPLRVLKGTNTGGNCNIGTMTRTSNQRRYDKCENCYYKPKRARERLEARRKAEEKKRIQEKQMQKRREEEKKRKEKLKQQRMAEERRRRQAELKKQRMEEERKRQEKLKQQRIEEERKRQEELKKQRMEEERKIQELKQQRMEEERKRQEELKKQRMEEERKRQEELNRQKEEAERKIQELNQKIEEEENKRHIEELKKFESKMNTFLEEKREKRNHTYIKENQKVIQNEIRFSNAVHNSTNIEVEDVLIKNETIHIPEDLQLTKDNVLLLLKQVAMIPDIRKCKINDVIGQQSVLFQSIIQQLLFSDEEQFYGTNSLMPFKWLQVYFLELYSTFSSGNRIQEPNAECLHEILATLAEDAIDIDENIDLAQTLYLMYIDLCFEIKSPSFTHIKSKWNPQLSKHGSIQIQFLQHAISKANTSKAHEPTNWSKSAFSLFLKLCIPFNSSDNDSHINFQRYFMNLILDDAWQPHEVIQIFGVLSEKYSPESLVLASFLEIVRAYKLLPKTQGEKDKTILDMIHEKGNDLEEIVSKLKNLTEKEVERDLDELLEVIKENEWATEEIIVKVQYIVKGAIEQLSEMGYPNKISEVISEWTKSEWTKDFDRDKEIGSLSERQLLDCLVTLCCAVNKHKGFWPRVTQMVSWTLLLLSDESTGCMIEIATGEGKSCIIAMVAAMIACHKKSVDIVTSSPVLAIRDSEEWAPYYELFGLNVNHNIHGNKLLIYEANIVYGTVGGFAADILKHEFQLENTRGNREFDSVIVDEVDFMLLDQGVQFTYLSHKSAGLRHLEPILGTVWNFVSHYKPAASLTGDIFLTGIPRPFYLALADVMDTEIGNIEDLPFKLLQMSEDEKIVRPGFTQEVHDSSEEKLMKLLSEVSTDDMVRFIEIANDYIPYTLQPYILRSDGKMELAGTLSPLSGEQLQTIPFLVAEKGLCCILHSDETALKNLVVDAVKEKLQEEGAADEDKIDIMATYYKLVMKRLPAWIDNAFMAMKMVENRHYLIKDGEVLPIDFTSTGMVEINKKWGGGLQQFVQLKHKLKLSSMTMVTNFISNISFFKRYSGETYAVTGTLGSVSDQEFLKDQFNVELCCIPTYKVRKLYEEKGEIMQNEETWMNRICEKVKENINERPWGSKGRAALIICEDISTAKKIHDTIRDNVTSDLSLYSRSDTNELDLLPDEMHSGQVLVATNLAGRGTNIPVTEEVNMSGGLYVLVTFLPMNTRIEKQAFGRTGRKGQPGSAEIILNAHSLTYNVTSQKDLKSLKENRDNLEKERMQIMEESEVAECLLKESLFDEYCSKMHETVNDIDDMDDRKIATDSMNENWGIWLQEKSDEVAKLEQNPLFCSLNEMIQEASNDIIEKKSANVYDIIKYGNECMISEQHDLDQACKLYTKAIHLNEKWAMVAFYNRAYCKLVQAGDNYMEETKEDLCKALESLVNYKTEVILTKTVVDRSWAVTNDDNGFAKNVETRVQLLDFFESKINEAINKLDEIQDKGRDAEAHVTTIFSLVSEPDELMHDELFEMYELGLVSVFSVEEKPRFCWEGLVVLLLGALQIVAGIFVTALSMGTLTSIGIGMVTEGVSDVILGIEALVTGEFKWKDWAIGKAISIGISIAGFGIVKIFKEGLKALKTGLKQTFKQLKALPSTIKEIRKEGMKLAMKEKIKLAGKHVTKELVEQGVIKGISVTQKKAMDELIKEIEDKLIENIKEDMIKKVKSGKISSKIDCIVAHFYKDSPKNGQKRCYNLTMKMFQKFGDDVVEPFLDDLEWKGYLSKLLQGITDKVRQGNTKYEAIFKFIDYAHIAVAIGDGLDDINKIVTEFEKRVTNLANEFIEQEDISELDKAGIDILKEVNLEQMKVDIGSLYAELMGKCVSQIFRSRVTGLVASKLNGKCKDVITNQMDKHILHKSDTEEKLRQNMDEINKEKNEKDTQIQSLSVAVCSYIKDIEDDNPRSWVDLKILSSIEGKQIVVKELDEDGTMKTTLDVGPDNDDPITLVYIAKNDKYPEGHYQPFVNEKTLKMDNQGNNSLYYAIALFKNTKLADADLNHEATKLKQLEIEELTNNSQVWKSTLKQHQWALNIRRAHEKRLVDAGNGNFPLAPNADELIVKNNDIGMVGSYKDMQTKNRRSSSSVKTNLDHQPPFSCIKEALNTSTNKLSVAMSKGLAFKEGDNKVTHESMLISKHVLAVHHKVYLTTGSSTDANNTRKLITDSVVNDDPVTMFKLSFLATSPTFIYEFHKSKKTTERLDVSLIDPNRRKAYEDNGVKEVLDSWYNNNLKTGDPPPMSVHQYQQVLDWINKGGYKDSTDPDFIDFLKKLS